MYSDQELREIARAAKALAGHAAALKVAEEPQDVRRSAKTVALSVRRLALRLNPESRYGKANIITSLPALRRPNSADLGPLLTTILFSLKSIGRCVGLYGKSDWGKPAKIDQVADDRLWLFVEDIRGAAALAVDELGKAATDLDAEIDRQAALGISNGDAAALRLGATKRRHEKRHEKKSLPSVQSAAFLRFFKRELWIRGGRKTEIAQEYADKNGGNARSWMRIAQRYTQFWQQGE